jgi:hypothetical protein
MSARERAHREATRTPVSAIAQRLQEILGQRITAYAVGVRDPRAIGRYAREDQKPREDTELRLRQVYEIAQVLLVRETPETVRAWLLGSHPLLQDRSPIELLHEEDHPPVERTASADTGYLSVMSAAEEFSRSA